MAAPRRGEDWKPGNVRLGSRMEAFGQKSPRRFHSEYLDIGPSVVEGVEAGEREGFHRSSLE